MSALKLPPHWALVWFIVKGDLPLYLENVTAERHPEDPYNPLGQITFTFGWTYRRSDAIPYYRREHAIEYAGLCRTRGDVVCRVVPYLTTVNPISIWRKEIPG